MTRRPGFLGIPVSNPKVYRLRDHARSDWDTPIPAWRLVLYGVLFALFVVGVMCLPGLLTVLQATPAK